MRSKYSISEQAVLDYIDAHGPVSTPQIMHVGLDPRALHALAVAGVVVPGPEGFERRPPSRKSPLKIDGKSRTFGEGKRNMGPLPIPARALVADWRPSLGNKLLKACTLSLSYENLRAFVRELECSKLFGSAKLARRLWEALYPEEQF